MQTHPEKVVLSERKQKIREAFERYESDAAEYYSEYNYDHPDFQRAWYGFLAGVAFMTPPNCWYIHRFTCQKVELFYEQGDEKPEGLLDWDGLHPMPTMVFDNERDRFMTFSDWRSL